METKKPLDSVGWLGGSDDRLVINEAARRRETEMSETIGQREDDKAFRQHLHSSKWEYSGTSPHSDVRKRELRLMREAFDAGMERGEHD